jgi:pyruvate/2-oxoglutarate dehydrogenase complex dihydrolipoamide dehydrogenase (E3) component
MLKCKYLIIGSGETGLILAKELSKLKEKVILVEQADLGGSFLQTTDYPKTLLTKESEEFATALKSLKNHPDTFLVLRKFRQKISDNITNNIKIETNSALNTIEKYENTEILVGTAQFNSSSLVEVNSETERHLVNFEKVIIAVGKNRMKQPKLKGLSRVNFLFRHNVFLFKEIPSKLAIIGCALETLEVASVYSGLGVKVSIFEEKTSEQTIPKLDRTGFNYAIKELMKRNVNFYFETKIREIKQVEKKLILVDDNRKEYEKSHIYVIVDEFFKDNSLKLDKIQLSSDESGIETNNFGKTKQNGIFALGNCSNKSNQKNKYSLIYNFIKKEADLQKKKKGVSAVLDLKNYFGDRDFLYPTLRINKINTYCPVINVGLSERNAKAIHGTYIETEIIEDYHLSGFFKIVYKTNNNQVLGITCAGDFCKKFTDYAILALSLNQDYKTIRNYIRTRYGV